MLFSKIALGIIISFAVIAIMLLIIVILGNKGE